jgi:hypothetical protein
MNTKPDPITVDDLLRMCADIEDRMEGFTRYRVEIHLPKDNPEDPFAALSFGAMDSCRRVRMMGAIHVKLPANALHSTWSPGGFIQYLYCLQRDKDGNAVTDGWMLEDHRQDVDITKPVVELSNE